MPFPPQKKDGGKNKQVRTNTASTSELPLAFFSPSRQPLVHAALQVVIDIRRLRRTKSFSQKPPSALSISNTGLLQEKPGSEVLVHHTKCQTCLGDSGEQRGEAELWLRPWETFHCSIKKRDGFFLGSRGEGGVLERVRWS